MAVQDWSTTASSNNAAPPNGAPEGQPPGSLNNCIREVMASTAVEAQINHVKVLGTVAGTNTITALMTPALVAYSAGMLIVFTPANNNTSATTLAINGLTALDVFKEDGDTLKSGDLVAGIPAVLVLDSGADDWILLNPCSQVVDTLNLRVDEAGFKGLPQNTQNSSYGLVLADSGKHVISTGGSGGITYTIPANASVAFPIGTSIVLANFRTSGDITVAITTDTLLLGGAGTSGSRTLSVNGVATILKITAVAWVITGTGLS